MMAENGFFLPQSKVVASHGSKYVLMCRRSKPNTWEIQYFSLPYWCTALSDLREIPLLVFSWGRNLYSKENSCKVVLFSFGVTHPSCSVYYLCTSFVQNSFNPMKNKQCSGISLSFRKKVGRRHSFANNFTLFLPKSSRANSDA